MHVCIPVTTDGQVDPSWGRAARVAVAEIQGGSIMAWEEFPVGWDALHDATTEGGHHARVARFLQDKHVETVAAGHMGDPMVVMLERMGIAIRLGVEGEARQAAISAADGTPT